MRFLRHLRFIKAWKKATLLGLLVIIVASFSLLPKANSEITSASTYTNPLVNGPDPFMVYSNGYYYYLKTEGNAIDVWKSRSMVDLEHATSTRVFTPTSGTVNCCNIWAPELHFFNNKWYIYFAADDGSDINHRMYVLESSTADPLSSYSLLGKVYDPNHDTWAIDGTVFQHSDGNLYFVWSGRSTNSLSQPQNIYIAPMSNPYTISGDRVLISQPQYSWETISGAVNEGPAVLQRNGNTFITYSASFFNTPDYSLGMLTNSDGQVLSPSSWTKSPNPVFQKTDQVFGPGHNAFTISTDGSEDYIVYHARNTTSTSEARSTRVQKFTWNADGTPNFGSPIAAGVNVPLPSGDVPGDLTVDRFVLTDAAGLEKTTFTEGEPIYPKVILHNIGGLGVDTPTQSTYTHFYSNSPASASAGQTSDVNIYLKNGEFAADFSKEYGASPIGPNASFYQGNKSWTKPAGTYTARVYIDFDNSGIESNYANNQRVVFYTVTSSSSATPTPTLIPTATPTPTPTFTPTPTPADLTPPSVAITSPQNGSSVSRRSTVGIAASASDVSGISKVEFSIDGTLLCTDTLAPYTCAWTVPNKPKVTYSLSARAVDIYNNSATRSISVISR